MSNIELRVYKNYEKRGLKLIITSLFFIFIVSGCTLDLRKIDDKIGEGLDAIEKNKKEDLISIIEKDISEEGMIGKNNEKHDLNSEQRELINKWLEDNGFNRYGDPVDTMYTGGTPLFNEGTGESIDRYDYIIDRHSDILNLLNNSNATN